MEQNLAARACPNCGGNRPYLFHRIADVPVNSCLLYENRKGAIDLACGNIDLTFCPDCSFVYNAAWRPERTTYNADYEETQEFSDTFSTYQKRQAMDLLARYGVIGKKIVEIGCGKGEFLSLLCELGHNSGVGYDPSFVPSRRNASTNVEFRRELFTSTTSQSPPDLVCCKMTLEHISETRLFVENIRRIASPERGTVVCIQVPDVRRILSEAAFWDVYYEHCSYFSPTSLQRVLRDAGFDVLRIETGFGEQYLTLEARAARTPADPAGLPQPDRGDDLHAAVSRYSDMATRSIAGWRELLRVAARMGKRTVLWGSGSKAVAFLSAVGADSEIDYLIDINPYRWGKYVPSSGKQIMPPEVVTKSPPDLVIAMNPNYIDEISSALRRLRCSTATLLALGTDLPGVLPTTFEWPKASWTHAPSAAQ
jgi:hypothetical protein